MDVLKITPDMAAAIIGKHSQFIRIGLQRGLLTYHGEPITTVSKTTKVTGKGQVYFVNKFLARGE